MTATGSLDPRIERIVGRVRAIPTGFVRTYGDIDPGAPRLVGHVLATTNDKLPWHRVVRSDGSIPMRGERVDLRQARLPQGMRFS